MKKQKLIQIKEINRDFENPSTMNVERIKELLAEDFLEYYHKKFKYRKDNIELKQEE